jgi:hypothetical protein
MFQLCPWAQKLTLANPAPRGKSAAFLATRLMRLQAENLSQGSKP